MRDDVSDTLPGVAIAISLVPPLAVVGLTLESGAPKQALGALLLFLTNFGAILLTGLIVMAIYRVRATAVQGSGSTHGHPRLAVAVVVAFVIVLAAPLAVDSAQITSQQLTNTDVTTVANNWADKVGWQVVNVSTTESGSPYGRSDRRHCPTPTHCVPRSTRTDSRAHPCNSSSTRSSESTSPAAEPRRRTDAAFALTPTEAWSVPRRSGCA